MKNISKFRVQSPESRTLLILFSLFTVYCLLYTHVHASEKWPGVDETVVERYANEHGREAREPLINTDQGDLLLFVFLMAGAVAGFAAGYYWKALMDGRPESLGAGIKNRT